MKTRYKLLFSVLLVWAQVLVPSLTGRAGGGASLSAQEAFYVYRNDGDFNGFFYDQVIRMGYSKFDLDSVEHDKYVIQEIETKDSLYRIPLAAIDSIGFQQPEIILNPKLKYLGDTGLRPYVKNAIHHWVYNSEGQATYMTQLDVDDNVPRNLLPQIGDVLVEWDEDWCKQMYLSVNGFGGKVISIKPNGDYLSVLCEKLTDLSDVFIQFISTESITVDKHGNTSRRLAGWSENEPRKASQGSSSKALVDFEGTFKRTFSPKQGVDIALECAVELMVKLNVSYYISLSRLFVKTDFLTHAAVQPSLSLQASTSFDAKADVFGALGTIRFPVNLPLFQTKPFPALDVKATGSANLQLTLPQVKFDYNQSITFDSNSWPMMTFTKQEDDPDEKAEEVPFETAGDLSLSLNGSLQVGTEFSANIATNDWIEDIFSSGIEMSVMVGPKLEGRLNLSAAGLADDGAYGLMKKSYIKFHKLSADLEAKAHLKFLWKDKENTTFLETSKQWGTVDWYLFPDFNDIKAEYDDQNRQIEFSTMTKKKTFLPNFVNVGLYDYDNNPIEKYQHTIPVFLATDSMEVKKKFEAKKAGQYRMKYGVSVLGFDVNVGEKWVKVPAFVRHANKGIDSMAISGEAQKIRELIETNVAKLEDVSAWGGGRNGIGDNYFLYFGHDHLVNTVTISDLDTNDESAWLNLDIIPNNTYLSRTENFFLSTRDGAIVDRDTLRIMQQPIYNDILKAGITFNGAAYTYKETQTDKNGTKTYESSVRLNPEYSASMPLSCSRNGDVFTLSGNNIGWNDPYKGEQDVSMNLTVDLTNRVQPVIEGFVEVKSKRYGTTISTERIEIEHRYKKPSSGSVHWSVTEDTSAEDHHGYSYFSCDSSNGSLNTKSCTVERYDYTDYNKVEHHFDVTEVKNPTSVSIRLYY